MKYNPYYVLILILTVGLAGLAVSCTKMDEHYKEFLQGGEITYIGKADSIVFRGGRNRAEIGWLVLSDPKVDSYKVYWNNKRDSVTGPIVKTDKVDTIRVNIDNLVEGTYQFEIVLFDKTGNSSILNNVIGQVYGQQYQESLLNRTYKAIKRTGRNLEINWMLMDETLHSVELSYLDRDNKTIKKVVSATAEWDTLANFPIGGTFEYRSVFLPDTLALDKFYTPTLEVEELVQEQLVSKTGWKAVLLPTDTYEAEFSSWKIENLWDNNANGNPNFFYQNPNIPGLALPNWFTIDLGSNNLLTKIKVLQLSHADAWIFNYGAPKTFEIYGSNAPAEDGSWTGWTLLGDFASVKPSGSAVSTLTAEDIAVGKNGETFAFANTETPYRYIRFKTKSTWGGNNNVMISELTLWGYPAE